MVKFKLFGIGLMSVILLAPQFASAHNETKLTRFNLSTKEELKEFVAANRNTNILLYGEDGKILNEYHSDGNIVNYYYDANGNMAESTDSHNGKQIYKTDPVTKEFKIESYYKNALVKQSTLTTDEDAHVPPKPVGKGALVTPMSTTVYEDYTVNGLSMNQLITDAEFTNSAAMTQTAIQSLFVSFNSILKDSVTIYTISSSGIPVYSGTTIIPAAAISSAATANGINPKVILVTLQKESSLVKDLSGNPPPSYASRRFYFAMGYGASDSGDDWTKSGFNVQITGGTQTLKNRYTQAPSTGYPLCLPDGTITSINFGVTKTSGGVTYKNYVWVKNRATYSLYRYTPHTIDTSLLPTIGGGNYLFVNTAKGWWGTSMWS